jgi:cytochrome P450
MKAQSQSILDPAVLRCPYPFYEAMRKDRPITFLPELGAWFVSSYELVKRILTDSRFHKGSEDGRKYIEPNRAAQQVLLTDELGLPLQCLSQSTGTRQVAFKRIVEPFLGRGGSHLIEPYVQSCATELLDQIEAHGHCELVNDFSTPFTVWIISEIIGFPRSMYPQVRAYGQAALTYVALPVPEPEAVAAAHTLIEMHHVILEMVRERRRNPRSDMLSALGTTTVEGRPLSDKEIVYILEEVVVGGHETTSNAINAAILHLSQNPELQTSLRANPDKLPAFVEEVLRLLSPIQATHRLALQDVEIEGVSIPKGAKVYLSTASANRDDARFLCPEQLDVERSSLNKHIAFGGGQHFCLGAHLTRVEQRIAYGGWLERFAAIELDQPVQSIQYQAMFATRAPVALRFRVRPGTERRTTEITTAATT